MFSALLTRMSNACYVISHRQCISFPIQFQAGSEEDDGARGEGGAISIRHCQGSFASTIMRTTIC